MYQRIYLTLLLCLIPTPATFAQSITPSPDGTGTVIEYNGNTYNITGGTQVGTNLFHSFAELGLSPNEIANFLSQPDIQNILGRVTGGNPSIIEGLIQVTGGNSNLYLMNPSGIIFGQGASLNVPASFTATTADAIGLENGFFSATGNNNYQSLVGSPTSFVFASSNPGTIINAADLSVIEGQNLALIGGSIINTGTLAGGNITLAAVPGRNAVRISQEGMILGLEVSPQNIQNGISAVDLPRLLTTPNLRDATGIRVGANGQLFLVGSNVTINPEGNVNIAGTVTGENVNLAAANRVIPIGDPLARVRTGNGTGSAPTVTIFPQNPTDSNAYIFLDATVPDYTHFLYGGEGGTTTVVVTPSENGIEKITNTLGIEGIEPVDEVHILSEGSQGNFWLGNAFVSSENVGQYQTQLQSWSQGLSPGADILIYACLTALGQTGNRLLSSIAGFTGADVAGSTNVTGSEALGGDWILERSIGKIEATIPFEPSVLANYAETLATFTVQNTADAGVGSLRDAISQANGLTGDDEIRFNPGVFNGMQGAISLTSGQLEIDTTTGNLTISGEFGASNVVVERTATALDFRIFNIVGNGNTTFDSLTIRNGKTTGRGGGINNTGTGTVAVTGSTVSGNSTSGNNSEGGGIFSRSGDVTITSSTISGNSTTGAFSEGGGIFSESGAVAVTGSTVSGNFTAGYSSDGGGIFSELGSVTITGSTVLGNSTAGTFSEGGGIFNRSGGVTVTNSTVSGNFTAGDFSDGGGIFSQSGGVTITGSTVSGNFTTGRNSEGGGIFNRLGAVTVINSTVSDNYTTSAFSYGGGIFSGLGDMTVTSSTVSGNSTSGRNSDGGGIFGVSGDMKITDSTVSGNSTSGNNSDGGGIYSRSGDLTVTGSTVSGNFTTGDFSDGGGIYSGSGDLTVTDSTVSGNYTTGDNSEGGGAIGMGDVTVIDSTVSGNFTTGLDSDGGGIASARNVMVIGSTVSGNSTTGVDGDGGAIANFGNVTVIGSTISGNSTTGFNGNGGAIASAGNVTVIGSTISGNSNTGYSIYGGGAIANFGNVTVTSSTVSGNSSYNHGGGIFSRGNVNIINSTITNNTADADNNGTGDGGGIFGSPFRNRTLTFTLSNTILAGNIDSSGEAPDAGAGGQGTVIFDGDANNLIGSTAGITNGTLGTGSDIVNPNPELAPLGNYGGTTQTHALLPNSPALNAGDNALIPVGLTTDQRGAFRIQGARVDIGAFESQGFVLIPNGTLQSTQINTAFSNPLSVQLAEAFANSPIPFAGLNIAFTAPTGGASGTFGMVSVTTDANGVASTSFIANGVGGTYQVMAEAMGITPAIFDLTNTVPPPQPQPQPRPQPTPQPQPTLMPPPELNAQPPRQTQPQAIPNLALACISPRDPALQTIDELLPDVAGLMNAQGGSLSINLHELLRYCGEYLMALPGNQRLVKQYLFEAVEKRVGRDYRDLIDVSFVQSLGNLTAVVEVKESLQPAFLDAMFYVREGGETRVLNLEAARKYIERNF